MVDRKKKVAYFYDSAIHKSSISDKVILLSCRHLLTAQSLASTYCIA